MAAMGFLHKTFSELSPESAALVNSTSQISGKIHLLGLIIVMLFKSMVIQLAYRHHSCDALAFPIDAVLLTLLAIERA